MPSDNNYTAHLLERIAQHADRKAFEALFRTYYERLFHFSLNFLHDRNAAEEVVSDVFVKIWRNNQRLDNIQNVDNYLFVATKHQSFNYLQKYADKQVSIQAPFNPDHLIEWFDPQKELEYQELMHDMELAVEGLPEQCKVVFKLIREEGFRYKEVADILEISVRTVETQLFRAMKKLSIALEAHMGKKKSTKKTNHPFITPLWLTLLIFLP